MPKLRRRFAEDTRTVEQIVEHYHLEKRLAATLRRSTRQERRTLYAAVYNELYSSLPHHPRHSRRTSPGQARAHVDSQMCLLRPFLRPDAVFMEIGAGDGILAREVADHVRSVYGVEVSTDTARDTSRPANMLLLQYDGCTIPLAPGSVDVAFSSAVMEHLHPDDAYLQLQNVATALAAGGKYVFYTPHRHMGPGDISKYFDTIATGFHLKEYTFRELQSLLKLAGFRRVQGLVWLKGSYRTVPVVWLIVHETLLGLLPYRMRYAIAWNRFVQRLVQIRIVATK
jgi:SAM-dependent methyltransferase